MSALAAQERPPADIAGEIDARGRGPNRLRAHRSERSGRRMPGMQGLLQTARSGLHGLLVRAGLLHHLASQMAGHLLVPEELHRELTLATRDRAQIRGV